MCGFFFVGGTGPRLWAPRKGGCRWSVCRGSSLWDGGLPASPVRCALLSARTPFWPDSAFGRAVGLVVFLLLGGHVPVPACAQAPRPRLVATLSSEPRFSTCVAFSADGRMLAVL